MEHFRTTLKIRQQDLGSCLCVGLDPDPTKAPKKFWRNGKPPRARQVLKWMKEIVDITAAFASAYKPNRAYWENLKGNGERALRKLIKYIKKKYPAIVIILDAKRGDIGRTMQQYREAHFERDGADAVNCCAYMGKTAFHGLYDPEFPERSVINLIYTSNPDAREVQDALMEDGKPLWQHMAKWTLDWAVEKRMKNIGFVMAAAYLNDAGVVYSDHLTQCRKIDQGEAWYLIPGYGAQGGALEETIEAAWTRPGSIVINSSSGICMASQGEDYKEAAAKAAEAAHLAMKEKIKELTL